MHLLNLLRHCVCQVEITVLNSKSSGIVFLGAPYSFYTVDGVPVNYSIGIIISLPSYFLYMVAFCQLFH